jgi:hypothetical protein
VKKIVLILFISLFPIFAYAGDIRVCAINDGTDDWSYIWHWGKITFPAGTVFDDWEDSAVVNDYRNDAGAVILQSITIEKNNPCGEAPAMAVISPENDWTIYPIFSNGKSNFSPYSLIENGKLWYPTPGEENNGFEIATGDYDNDFPASVIGTLSRVIYLDKNSQN